MKGISVCLLVVLLLVGAAACATPPTPAPLPTLIRPTATPVPLPTATPLPTTTLSPTPTPVGLYVDAGENLGAVSRLAFGTNHGPWAFLTVDVWPQFKASGISLIRFPGGNWGDENNLESWHLDAFIPVARMVNAETLFSARLRGGTPEQAVALLRLAAQQGLRVKYWSIGNEPDLFKDYDTAQFNSDWRKFALALKAADPSIILVGPDISQFTGEPSVDPKDKNGKDWLREFLTANGDLVDVVAVHRYPFPAQINTRPTRAELFANAAQWDSIPVNLRAIVRETTGRALPIGITEFNSSWSGSMGGETGMDTFNNALWLGDVLGRLIRQRVDLLAQFTLTSDSNVGGYGLFERYSPRPSYYTYLMYKDFGDQLVSAQAAQCPVSVYAARQGDALTVMLVNLSDQSVACPLLLERFTPNGAAQVKLFDAQHKATRQPDLVISAKTDLTVPLNSMLSLHIPGK